MSKKSKYGITVDIGTSNIIIHLVRLADSIVVNQFFLKNPQRKFGSDVVTRIKRAQESAEIRLSLVHEVRNAVNRGISGVLSEQGLGPSSVSDVVIVGNTVMHHLFFDLSTDSLLIAPYVTDNKSSSLTPAADVGLDSIPKATVYSPPIVESFVGPDALAVLIASSFLDRNATCMTIDVGTNTEVSIITPRGIWIASAASGPAFEGMAIQCGMDGEMGAIKGVSLDKTTFEPILSIIDDTQPIGICGTGAISLLASLLNAGLLLPRGSFNRDVKSPWASFDSDIAYFLLAPGDSSSTRKDIILSQPDVRIQQSKAAIRATIESVLKESDSTADDIGELFLTGMFGSDLQIEDAYRIGLLPPFSNTQITQSRNGAIRGADLFLDRNNRHKVEKLVQETHYIELMDKDEFDEYFVKFLPFPSK